MELTSEKTKNECVNHDSFSLGGALCLMFSFFSFPLSFFFSLSVVH